MLRNATFKIRLLALCGVAAMVVAGVGLWRTDLLLIRGFGKALQGAGPTLTFQPASGTGQTQVAGDEGYWLTRADVESPTPFAKPLAPGDRITISSSDGRARQLEIIDLKAIGMVLGKIGTAGAQPHLMVVTCRTLGEGDRGPVRFIIEADPIDPGTASRAKTL